MRACWVYPTSWLQWPWPGSSSCCIPNPTSQPPTPQPAWAHEPLHRRCRFLFLELPHRPLIWQCLPSDWLCEEHAAFSIPRVSARGTGSATKARPVGRGHSRTFHESTCQVALSPCNITGTRLILDVGACNLVDSPTRSRGRSVALAFQIPSNC